MQLGPSSFLATPSLPTFLLEGAAESNGHLRFSADDRLLLACGDSGRLQVWDVATRQRILSYNESDVRGVTVAEHLGGILVSAADGLLLFMRTGDGFAGRSLAAHLPGLCEPYLPDSIDAAVVLFATTRQIICCTRRYIVTLDALTYQPIKLVPLLQHADRNLEHLSIGARHGTVLIRTISSVQKKNLVSYLYTEISVAGATVAEMLVEIPGYRLIAAPYTGERPGIITGISGMTIVFIQSALGVTSAFALPFETGMSYTASASGTTIVGKTASSVVFWAGSELLGRYGIEDRPCDIKLTDDGRLAAILFCDDLTSPNVTGLLDLSTGRQVGHCTGHLIGLAPVAFSPSGRFFATLITDGTASYHPDSLPSGTVILTELPVGDHA
jgi:WD40 repeat protein